jgi:hypothetical protein
VSPEVSLAVVTGVLSLVTAGILALVNSWMSTRAGIDESLRGQRLEVYPALWKATAAASRWPRVDASRGSLTELHRDLRSWYYGPGGIFLSESARARYGDFQELIAALIEKDGDPAEVLAPQRYTDLMETASALRTALTEDLDTRRRKSFREARRRSREHAQAKQKAQERISRATGSAPPFGPRRSDRSVRRWPWRRATRGG